MIFILLFVAVILMILIFFSFPELSPVPYFPSNEKDKDIILKILAVKNNEVIIDFGAGDGWVLFEAAHIALAKSLNTRFILTEINPFLIFLLQLKRLMHPNRRHITVLYRDIFKMEMKTDPAFSNFKKNTSITVYMYLSPRFLSTLTKKIYDFNKNASIVTYFYPLPDQKPIQTYVGKHAVYLYNN